MRHGTFENMFYLIYKLLSLISNDPPGHPVSIHLAHKGYAHLRCRLALEGLSTNPLCEEVGHGHDVHIATFSLTQWSNEVKACDLPRFFDLRKYTY